MQRPSPGNGRVGLPTAPPGWRSSTRHGPREQPPAAPRPRRRLARKGKATPEERRGGLAGGEKNFSVQAVHTPKRWGGQGGACPDQDQHRAPHCWGQRLTTPPGAVGTPRETANERMALANAFSLSDFTLIPETSRAKHREL